MQEILYSDWSRREHFEFYSFNDLPLYSITATIDVTNLYNYTKSHNISFYYGMIYAATLTMNKIDNFKTRVHNDKVIIYDELIPSFIVMSKDTELHKIINCPLCATMIDYDSACKKTVSEKVGYFPSKEEENMDNYIYISCIPWLTYTSLSHVMNVDKNDFIPRIDWGKYYSENDRVKMPITVMTNHRIADGIHIAKFVNNLQAYINHLL